MKICLYIPLKSSLNGNGVGSAIKHQIKALELANIEYTFSIDDDFDILHINFPDPLSLYAIEKAKLANKKVIIHTHTTAEDFKDSFILSGAFKPVVKRYLKNFYNQADLILCPSEYTKNLLIEKYKIKKPIKVISNGIEVEKFNEETLKQKREIYRKKYNLKGTVVFSVGIVVNRKGVKTFINIAKNFKSLNFVWYGTIYHYLAPIAAADALIKNLAGIIYNKLQSKINEIKMGNNILFTGYVDDIIGAYASGDIFLFPSKEENQGIALLEAIASKKPCIIRNLPVFDWLEDGKDCLKANTDEEFAEKLKILIDDEKLRKNLAENAYRKLLAKGHDIKDVSKKLREIYENLIKV